MDNNKLLEILSPLLAFENLVINETWGSFNVQGQYHVNLLSEVEKIYTFFSNESAENALQFKINNVFVSTDDLEAYFANTTIKFKNWDLNINKMSFIDEALNSVNNFFYCKTKFELWLSNLDPFDLKNPFHFFKELKIIVLGINEPILGKYFQILPLNSNAISIPVEFEKIPNKEEVNKIVHQFADKNFEINPINFIVYIDNDTSIEKQLRRMSILSLSVCITNEFFSMDKITLDGIRRVNIVLSKNEDILSINLRDKLIDLVIWIYEDKPVTRQKLFADRLTLELDESNSLLHSLTKHLETSLSQAKQRYNFVILERKDKYISELKDLLKDIRSQSELYSQKIRALLNNLLRDILAAILLIGFTIFTKFSDNILLEKLDLLKYVFNGLALYYIISIVFQTIVDVTDIQVSKNEMFYWKKTSKELIPEKDFNDHINNSLKNRRFSLRIIYPIIVILYFLVALVCYKFPDYYSKWSNKTSNEKISTTKSKNVEDDKVFKCKDSADSCSQSRK